MDQSLSDLIKGKNQKNSTSWESKWAVKDIVIDRGKIFKYKIWS